MEKKRLTRTAILTILWMIIALAAAITATYAWFTFSPVTNVTPMSNTVSKGKGSLLISTSKNGPFKEECNLSLAIDPEYLVPVSTDDLNDFYAPILQNRQGISLLYKEADKIADDNSIHGDLYLKCEDDECYVYLNKAGLDFGNNTQALASMRLGFKITAKDGEHTYIFRLDDMGNTGGATSRETVNGDNVVVSAIGSDGSPSYKTDPAEDISDYSSDTSDESNPKAGKKKLCHLDVNEVCKVEFRLYLEGCDKNCFDDVQRQDLALALSFAGADE